MALKRVKSGTSLSSPSQRPYLYREYEHEYENTPIREGSLSTESLVMDPYPVARKVCRWGGLLFLLVGALGFSYPSALGAHLSATHNVVHLLSGLLLLIVGMKAEPSIVRGVCLGFGLAYALLGAAGFLFGSPGVSVALPGMGYDPFLLSVWADRFELGQNDHVLHLLLGGAFLLGGLKSARSVFSARMGLE